MSLRIAPASSYSTSTYANLGAPSAPGVHDTLRSRLNLTTPAPNASSSISATNVQLQSSHPLESRLRNWRATQDNLKMQLLRREFGIAEPVRRGMELDICAKGEWRPAVLGGLGGDGVHADILSGRDCEISWEDVFTGNELRDVPDFHTEMETRLRMNW